MNEEIEFSEITDRDNLAVVGIIEKIETIPNKDRIALHYIKDCGYTFICEKIHSIGDKVVYVKYDTIVPDTDLFSFMKEFKFRVKPKSFTEKDDEGNIVKKIYSQGIVLPITLLPEGNYEDGQDLTEQLGVKKWIPPVINTGSSFGYMAKKGDFPTHLINKTDELNLAVRTRYLEEIKGKDVYFTLKIEGSSLSLYQDDGRNELVVCSRNNQIGEHETNKFWKAVNKYDLKQKLANNYQNFAFSGELYGEGIQKNKLGISGVDVMFYNVTEKNTKKRLGYYEMYDILDELEVPMVPLLMIVKNFDWTFEELQKFADEVKYANGETAEGIVIRCIEPQWCTKIRDWWSFKVINRNYKL